MRDIKNIRLKESEVTYDKETHELYLRMVYEYEAKDGVHELHIPKMRLGIFGDKLPVIGREYMSNIWRAGCGLHEFQLYEADFEVPDKNGNLQKLNERYFADVLVKENPVEMTLEEIEKEIGYKIKIVSEKKEKEETEDVKRRCDTCRYFDKKLNEEPCRTCNFIDEDSFYWEAKE